MSEEKSKEFRKQYEEALKTLENDNTDKFLLIASDEDADMKIVYGTNEEKNIPINNIDMALAATKMLTEQARQM